MNEEMAKWMDGWITRNQVGDRYRKLKPYSVHFYNLIVIDLFSICSILKGSNKQANVHLQEVADSLMWAVVLLNGRVQIQTVKH
jgi:Ni,Fe-hydrogenase I large subunit